MMNSNTLPPGPAKPPRTPETSDLATLNALVRVLDFFADPAAMRDRINAYVAELAAHRATVSNDLNKRAAALDAREAEVERREAEAAQLKDEVEKRRGQIEAWVKDATDGVR